MIRSYMRDFTRHVTLLAVAIAMNVSVLGFADSEEPTPTSNVTVAIDQETGNLRVMTYGEAAKTTFEFMTTSRVVTATREGVGMSELRIGRNIACEHFLPVAGLPNATEVYRCGQLVTSSGTSVADGLSPMIGAGN